MSKRKYYTPGEKEAILRVAEEGRRNKKTWLSILRTLRRVVKYTNDARALAQYYYYLKHNGGEAMGRCGLAAKRPVSQTLGESDPVRRIVSLINEIAEEKAHAIAKQEIQRMMAGLLT